MNNTRLASSALAIATTLITASPAQATSLASGTFSLFLECNNDGTALLLDSSMDWQYSRDALGDMTDGSTYDLTGMGVFQDGSDVFVAIGSNLPLTGAGYDRSIDRIFHGDLFFTPSGGDFQSNMEAGNLYGIHFSGSQDSGANGGLGVYENVAAKGVGMQNFGHRTYNNYEAMVDSSSTNFYGNLDANSPYFNGDGVGYNVIASGDRVANDGFQMLTLSDLLDNGFDSNSFGGDNIFGFKFNLDAIVPPPPPALPKDVETLKGIGEGYGYDWDGQGWDEQLDEQDTAIAGHQADADAHQADADAHQADADAHQARANEYQARSNRANDEVKRLKQDEVNPRNSDNWRAARNSPGGDANNAIKSERNQRNNITRAIDKVNKTLSETPGKIDTATNQRDAAIARRDAVPSEDEAIATARDSASSSIQEAYTAVEDLTPKKEAWEAHKAANGWDEMSLDERLALQDTYNNELGGDWVELRGDGSLAKQEQELNLFSERITDFEAQVEQQRQSQLQQHQTEIDRRNNEIDNLTNKLEGAEQDKPQLEAQLEQFYNTNDLRDRLESILEDSQSDLAALDGSNLSDAEKAERRDFYTRDIERTQDLLDRLDDNNWQASLDTLFDEANQYFSNTLREDAKTSDRPIFDDSGNPATYSLEDVTVDVPVYDEDGNITGYTQHTVGEVGAPKTVASEYARREAEKALFEDARKKRVQARTQANRDKQDELSEKQADLNRRNQAIANKNTALSQKQAQQAQKDALLVQIESEISGARDAAIAQEKREQMQGALADAEAENQKEQALEDKHGARTPDSPGGIPDSPEAVVAMDVPEPSSMLGLLAMGSGLAVLRRRRTSR